jgi:hypothetical protein
MGTYPSGKDLSKGWPHGWMVAGTKERKVKTSRVVTVIEGVEVIELVREDPEGFPTETSYYVKGEKYGSLKEAREAAKNMSERAG